MPPLHVSHVSFNIKGDVVTDLALGPRTLILGPNGSGKSAIIDAVRFATSGTVADVSGKAVVATEGLISTLSTSKELFARVALSDGRQCQTTLTKGKKKAGPTLPEVVEWPVDKVKEALAGEADTTRRFLLSTVAQNVTDAKIEAYLLPYLDDYRAAIKLVPNAAKLTPLDRLTGVIDYAEKRASDLKKEATGVEKHGQDMGNGLGPEPSEASVAAAREAWEKALGAQGSARVSLPDLAQLEAKMNQLHADFERREAELTAAEATLASLPEASTTTTPIVLQIERLKALGRIASWHADKLLTDCQLCGRTLTDEAFERIRELPSACSESTVELEQLDTTQAQRDQKRRRVADLKVAVEIARNKAIAACDDYDAAEAVVNAAQPSAPTADPAPLRAAYEALKRTADRHAEVRRAYNSAGTKKAESAKLALLSDACKDAVKKLLKDCVSQFEERVQQYLPASDRFGVQLIDGAKEVARVGLWRGSDADGWELHTGGLSGSERARMLVAMASAISEGELAIVAMDDCSWDAVALRSVCDALVGQVLPGTDLQPLQVFIATTTAPQGVMVDPGGYVELAALPGWTIIQTGPLPVPVISMGEDPFGSDT